MNIKELVKNLSKSEKEELIRLCMAEESNFDSTFLELNNNHHCPHCDSNKIVKMGKNGSHQKFKCKECGKMYSIKTNTLFAHSNKSIDVWKDYIDLMIEGKSLRKIASALNINLKTAFYWRHKILDTLNKKSSDKLSGIVEADEAFFSKSDKGNKKLVRPARKRGGKSKTDPTKHKRGLSRDKVCVLCAIDRSKNIFNTPVGYGKMSSKQVKENLSDRIVEDAVLVTDGEKSYNTLADKVRLKTIKTGLTKNKLYHLQNINSYHSGLKGFMRKFNGVATKYLDNYVNFFKAVRSNQDVMKDILQINNLCRVADVNNKKIAF